MSKTRLIHNLNEGIKLKHNGHSLFYYDYACDIPKKLSPKPAFLHLGSLTGETLSGNKPSDHPWHQGLAMTYSDANDVNYWGGGSYIESEKKYLDRDDHGSQRPLGFDSISLEGGACEIVQRLEWRDFNDEVMLNEKRAMRAEVFAAEGFWQLRFQSALTNVIDQPVVLKSPHYKGATSGGYGSLFWRGPRDFWGCQVEVSDGRTDAEEINGTAADWIRLTGTHDGSNEKSSLLFVDHPGNVRYPNKWFVRSNPYPVVSFAFMFDEPYAIEPQATLDLTYSIIFANGAMTADEANAHVRRVLS